MRWRIGAVVGLVLLAGCGALQETTPSFRGKFVKGGLDSDFGDFVDANEGKAVRLDLQWEPGAFQGGTEKEFQFFVLFDSCAEPLEKGEGPAVGNCNGTEYNVPRLDGKALITQDGGRWRLRGVFTPGEKTGPQQGLFAVALEPAP